MHIERILEALRRYGEYDEREELPEGTRSETALVQPDSAETDPRQEVSFQITVSELISGLMHLKMKGKVEETAAGYYCRTGRQG